MVHGPPSISPLARLFELAARSLHSAGFAGELYPAQWTALRYLAHAAPNDRTSAKLARFQQMAVGPVTRTVRTLIAKGLVVEAGTADHHRSKRIDLTSAGIDLLRVDPLISVDRQIGDLTREEARILGAVLGRIISTLHTPPDEAQSDGLTLDIADGETSPDA